MISNNIFRAIGRFCTEILFTPYNALRSIDGWWTTNIVNAIFIGTGFLLLLYWIGQLQKYSRAGNE